MSFNQEEFDQIEQRKTYEINQLYQTGNPTLINIALMIKEASKKAMKGCEEKNPDFSIFAEIEKKSIEFENKEFKENKKFIKGITKILSQSNSINIDDNKDASFKLPNIIQNEIQEIINQKMIQNIINKSINA